MLALLHGICDKFQSMALGSGVTLHADLPESLPAVYGDGLAQVFSNLVDNGLKFTPRSNSPRAAVR